MVKFLIIRFSSIGDIVLTTPLIRCLKKQVEEAEIHFLTKPQFLPVLKANPYIDRIHLLSESFTKLTNDLKKENFDYIVDLHHNLRSLRVKNSLKIISFSFNKLNFKKWLLVNFKKSLLPDIHIVDRYMETLKLFEVENDGQGLEYFLLPEDEINPGELNPALSEGYIVMVVGAKHNTKQVPEDIMLEICKNLKYPVILLGGGEDFNRGEVIRKGSENVYNLCGKLKLNQSASLVKQAKLVITPDTGLMHIAAAFKKKIISIWGNTIPEFGMYPYFPASGSKIFEIKGLSCRPCSKIGFEKCPKGHFKCMREHNTDEIVRVANELMQ